MQLQTCGDSSGAGHQSRLYPRLVPQQSAWNSGGTAGNVLSPRGLASSAAAPVYMVAQDTVRGMAEASRPPRACAGHWLSATLSEEVPGPAQNQGQGKHPPSASSTENVGPIFNPPPFPSKKQQG